MTKLVGTNIKFFGSAYYDLRKATFLEHLEQAKIWLRRQSDQVLLKNDIFNHTISLFQMFQKTPVLTTRHKIKNKKFRLAIDRRKGVFLELLEQTPI
jgi:hypothetical protein